MLYFLLMTYCSTITNRCEVVILPRSYTVEAVCRKDGARNSNANHEEIRDYTCISQNVEGNAS